MVGGGAEEETGGKKLSDGVKIAQLCSQTDAGSGPGSASLVGDLRQVTSLSLSKSRKTVPNGVYGEY